MLNLDLAYTNSTNSTDIVADSSQSNVIEILFWSLLGIVATSAALRLISLYCYRNGNGEAKRVSRAAYSLFGGGVGSMLGSVICVFTGSPIPTYVGGTVLGGVLGMSVGCLVGINREESDSTGNLRRVMPI